MRSLEVAAVKINGMIGYQIHGLHRACSDSLWEVVAHAAVFRDKARAERFLKKVMSKPSWNYDWQYWGVPQGHVVSSIDAFKGHVAPFSVL